MKLTLKLPVRILWVTRALIWFKDLQTYIKTNQCGWRHAPAKFIDSICQVPVSLTSFSYKGSYSASKVWVCLLSQAVPPSPAQWFSQIIPNFQSAPKITKVHCLKHVKTKCLKYMLTITCLRLHVCKTRCLVTFAKSQF